MACAVMEPMITVPVMENSGMNAVSPKAVTILPSVAGKSDTVDVVVSAHTLLRDLLLQADRLDPHAVADQGLRTLLPGEQVRFRVTGCGSLDAKRARSALFCADAR